MKYRGAWVTGLAVALLLPASGLEVGGLIPASVTWRPSDSPVIVTTLTTLAAGATLTIEPGVEVRMFPRIYLECMGNIRAEGTPDRPIRFVRHDPTTPWRRLDLLPNAAESRFIWCELDGAGNIGNIRAAGTTVHLEHVIFRNTTAQALAVEDTSLTARHCVFPEAVNDELLQVRRMPAGGHALIEGCVFAVGQRSLGIIDCSGGKRPGPIPRFVGNVFPGARLDVMAFAGNDAHIEGNIFLNVRQDAVRPDGANAIVAGAGGGQVSDLMICRNLFFNVDHALRLRDGGRAVMQNNTIVQLPDNPFAAVPVSAIDWSDPNLGVGPGGACLFEGNLVWQVFADRFVGGYGGQPFAVNHSLLPVAWPGAGNLAGVDPQLVGLDDVTADNLRARLALRPDSPARAAGPNGLDIGALVAAGPSISGEPAGSTTDDFATLHVAGPGIVAYRWRQDAGAWSGEVPLTNNLTFSPDLFADATPISLTNLSVGVHRVEVIGKNSAGDWTAEAEATASRPWIVRNELLRLKIVRTTAGEIRLRVDVVAGASYTLQSRADLTTGVWAATGAFQRAEATGELELLLSPAAEGAAGYFRVLESVAE